ncbi:hypothetical protein AERO_05050 [Aeromicrobium fastidiosum]|uniref:hypothetical protein n=1 Tax=Aeromicrobium fastidiosum TaxID=52699 RepID=UPI0020234525|nr:hypothetical protein [Aeromicrobium fastidiosum]MCL8250745.1 hypothetical protein [Aeromicrobium fastidiosum]
MTHDPAVLHPEHYTVVFENDRVRVLEYLDHPGEGTSPHDHPDSVMCTLTSFDRRLAAGEHQVDVHLDSGSVRWLDAQRHAGLNIGTTDTHALFVELKEPAPAGRPRVSSLGPVDLGAGDGTGAPH